MMRVGSRLPSLSNLRLPVASLLLLLLILAPVNAGQIQLVKDLDPAGGSKSTTVPPVKGPGPTQYCKCTIPNGYSATPGSPGQLCVNKEVVCNCDGQKADQPMCLYDVKGAPPSPPAKGPVGPP
jgi:hypothetical protein